MTDELDVLNVSALEDGRYGAPHPTTDPEGRNVVFSGQVMAQKIMAASHASNDKEVKSIHTIFARSGNYDSPLELELENMHTGRAWASHSITASQGGRLLSRSLVLMSSVEPDLIRNVPEMPDVPGPDSQHTGGFLLLFPGLTALTVNAPHATAPDGTPVEYYWMKYRHPVESVAKNQAVLAWSQPGMIIGLALRPHASKVSISDAHVSISTGVISHTAHFHEHFDVGDWLLVVQNNGYAGHGRLYGSGSVFRKDGTLVSTFGQDSMARGAEAPLDRRRSM